MGCSPDFCSVPECTRNFSVAQKRATTKLAHFAHAVKSQGNKIFEISDWRYLINCIGAWIFQLCARQKRLSVGSSTSIRVFTESTPTGLRIARVADPTCRQWRQQQKTTPCIESVTSLTLCECSAIIQIYWISGNSEIYTVLIYMQENRGSCASIWFLSAIIFNPSRLARERIYSFLERSIWETVDSKNDKNFST